MTVGGIDEEAASFSNTILFEKEEASITKEASSSSFLEHVANVLGNRSARAH